MSPCIRFSFCIRTELRGGVASLFVSSLSCTEQSCKLSYYPGMLTLCLECSYLFIGLHSMSSTLAFIVDFQFFFYLNLLDR